MKKTIAILLILVIGMVGVFAADSPRSSAEVDLKTSIDQILAIGVTGLTDGTAGLIDEETAFASLSAFETAAKAEALYETTDDMYDFVDDDPVVVAYFHAFSNANAAVYITVSATPFTTADNEDASIPLILSINGLGEALDEDDNPIANKVKVDAATGSRTVLANQSIGVNVSKANVDVAPASENYTATITFTIAAT
jgi:hypothetical protein